MLVCQKLKVSEPGHVTDAVAFFGRQREHTVQGQKQSVCSVSVAALVSLWLNAAPAQTLTKGASSHDWPVHQPRPPRSLQAFISEFILTVSGFGLYLTLTLPLPDGERCFNHIISGTTIVVGPQSSRLPSLVQILTPHPLPKVTAEGDTPTLGEHVSSESASCQGGVSKRPSFHLLSDLTLTGVATG